MEFSLDNIFATRGKVVKSVRISAAVEKAVEENKCITVPELCGRVKIKPTNDGKQLCVLMLADGSCPKTGWQPTAKQLMRDDWFTVD